MRIIVYTGLFLTFFLLLSPSMGADEEQLPLPRFVSLRAREINMRVGPGTEYEISWIYHQKNMPVEIVEEFYTWRKIRDWEGTVGWVHKNMLSGKRTAIIMGQQRIMRGDPDPQSKPNAFLEPGVVVILEECQNEWCAIEVPGRIHGWIERKDIWGIYSNEKLP